MSLLGRRVLRCVLETAHELPAAGKSGVWVLTILAPLHLVIAMRVRQE